MCSHILSEAKYYRTICGTTDPMRMYPSEERNRLILLYNVIVDSIKKLYPNLEQNKKPDSIYRQLKFLEAIPLREDKLNDLSLFTPPVAPTSRLQISEKKRDRYFTDGRHLCENALKTLRIVILSGYLYKGTWCSSMEGGEYHYHNTARKESPENQRSYINTRTPTLEHRYKKRKIPRSKG